MMSDTNWDLHKSENVDIYADNLTKTILNIASICIPNKNVCIRLRDLPWLNNNIKKKFDNESAFTEKQNNFRVIFTGQISVV